MQINIWGTVRSPTSWAHVTRELTLALDQRGHDVSVTACRGFLHDPGFPLPARVSALLEKPRTRQITLAFEYPPNYHRLPGRLRAGLLVYETSVLPSHWTRAILSHLHVLIVPSRFCARIMANAGVPEETIAVVPYGVRPELFNPHAAPAALATEKCFKFLSIAMPHKRKGLDALLRAYCREFSSSDDVCLVVKSSYRVQAGKHKPWETDFEQLLGEGASKRGSPEILYLCEPVSPDTMPSLYAACDCYLQPSRSEGFGLAILEAFACGKAAIVTGWGGHMDFCDDSNAYVLGYDLKEASDVQYDNAAADAVCAEPDIVHLRSLMRNAYEDRDALKKKSDAAAVTAAKYSWARTALETEEILLRIQQQQ